MFVIIIPEKIHGKLTVVGKSANLVVLGYSKKSGPKRLAFWNRGVYEKAVSGQQPQNYLKLFQNS